MQPFLDRRLNVTRKLVPFASVTKRSGKQVIKCLIAYKHNLFLVQSYGDMAELVDATDLKSVGSNEL